MDKAIDSEPTLIFLFPFMTSLALCMIASVLFYAMIKISHAMVERASTLATRRCMIKYLLVAAFGVLLAPSLMVGFVHISKHEVGVFYSIQFAAGLLLFIATVFWFFWRLDYSQCDTRHDEETSEKQCKCNPENDNIYCWSCQVCSFMLFYLYVAVLALLIYVYSPLFIQYGDDKYLFIQMGISFGISVPCLIVGLPCWQLRSTFLYFAECSKDETTFDQTRKFDPVKIYGIYSM